MSTEEPLAGGNVGAVVRVGDTVRRSTGPWMDPVHELLRHLEDVGFDWSPRVLGTDEQGREVLSYIEGETVGPRIRGRPGRGRTTRGAPRSQFDCRRTATEKEWSRR